MKRILDFILAVLIRIREAVRATRSRIEQQLKDQSK